MVPVAVLVDLALQRPSRRIGVEVGPAIALAQVDEDRHGLRYAHVAVLKKRDIARWVECKELFGPGSTFACAAWYCHLDLEGQALLKQGPCHRTEGLRQRHSVQANRHCGLQ
eukprot:scaffold18144_cov130-Isochrysis_galbana.AAC.8